MSRPPSRTPIFLALGLLSASFVEASSVASLRLSQAVQTADSTPTVRVYLDVLDREGEPVRTLDAEGLSATIGELSATPGSVEPLAASSEGVAYIFLIDISRSLSGAEFDRIREAIELWITSLGAADRIAVISFGESSRLELDFTADFDAAREVLARLGPSDDLTVLHRALRDGLDLARRRDAGLPGRRVLVVLTDGKDEGSGLSPGDLLAALRSDPIPIYAVGLSRLRSPTEREKYLALLHRLATNSGGAYVEANSGRVNESYSALLAAVRRVWVATLTCADCRLDGESYRLQVNLADGERVHSDGRRIRLLPLTAAPAPTDEPTTEDSKPSPLPATAPPTEEPADELPQPPVAETEGAGSRSAWWLLALLLALGGPLLYWLARRRSTGDRSPAADEPDPAVSGDFDPPLQKPAAAAASRPRGPYQTPTGVVTSRPPKPPSLRLVRLIVVRGQRVGRQYSMMLLERGVVGARSSCDCVLVDEPGVEAEQFELLQVDGRVYIRNLATSRPTLLDGLPIVERTPLESQTLVGNSDCILRLVYDEPQHVPI